MWWDICGLWRYREVAGRYVQVCGPYKSESKAGTGLLKGGTVRCGVVVSGAVEDFHGFGRKARGDTRVFGGTDGFARRVGGFGADHAFAVGYVRPARVSARRRPGHAQHARRAACGKPRSAP